ncbi:MAG: O-sialoglycoprotein endopeptidase [Peptostreptococcaceae bacterium]|nr:O-sialoglycoprotein endopeptidase [Peptostreptococcaceae bacterium]
MNKDLILGIDTSNYKTSIAVVDYDGNILVNDSKLLDVPKGEKGLRQSDAFFKHSNDLPNMLFKVLNDEEIRKNIKRVSVSTRPRSVEGSYMPVFRAGENAAVIMSSALGVPLRRFSHQEGHIKAIKEYSDIKNKDKFIAYHLSGGTTEALLVNNGKIEIIGGTKDIAIGQLIDRVGVKLGMDFPAGKEMDKIATCNEALINPTAVRLDEGFFNLSGIETQCMKAIEGNLANEMIPGMFKAIAELLINETKYLSDRYLINDFIFTGGVSSSEFIRSYLPGKVEANIYFGAPELSGDNAVGIALLGGTNNG